LVAECQDMPTACSSLYLTARCVGISKLDRGKFAAMVCRALDLAVTTRSHTHAGIFHIGDRQVVAGRSVPVFALFQGGSQPDSSVLALEALNAEPKPRLLLVPTDATLSSEQKLILDRNGTSYRTLDAALLCDADHNPIASDAITQLIAGLVEDVRQGLRSAPAGLAWPLPADAHWGEVKIAFISDAVINVTFRGDTRRFEPAQLSMTNAKNGKPTNQWSMLKAIAMGRGSIPFPDQAKLQKQKQSLSKKLIAAFGIQGDPIGATARAYQAGYVTNADGLTQGKQGASSTKFR